jgi:hypothetical protein
MIEFILSTKKVINKEIPFCDQQGSAAYPQHRTAHHEDAFRR